MRRLPFARRVAVGVAGGLLAAGCGAAGPPPDGTQPGDAGDGVEGPRVREVSPAPEARGLPENTSMRLRFSEPMDRASTQSAFSSPQMPSPRFTWDDDRSLTVTPSAPLPYAEGSAGIAATKIELFVSNAARTAGGRYLAPFHSAFYTLRRLQAELASSESLDGYVRADGRTDTCSEMTEDGAICVGDSEKAANLQYKGLVTFDLGPLPDGIAALERAQLALYQYRTDGKPYATLGVVQIEHLVYDDPHEAFRPGADRMLGVLSRSPDEGWKLAEEEPLVTAALQDDYAHRQARRGRSQYRLVFVQPTDGDGEGDVAKLYTAQVRRSPDPAKRDKAPKLSVTFLVP